MRLQLANLDRTDAAGRRAIDQRAERLKAALTGDTYL